MSKRFPVITSLMLIIALVLPAIALAAGTVTIAATGSASAIGDISNTEYRMSQSVIPLSGCITSFSFTTSGNNGSPTGGLYWEIDQNNAGSPGSILLSGSVPSPVISGVNTVSGLGGVCLDGSTTVFLVLYASAQSTDNRYSWLASTGSVYADGQRCYSSNGGSSWTCDNADNAMTITTSDPTPTPTATTQPTATTTPTATITPTLDVAMKSTLSSGVAYAIERSATFGDIALFAIASFIAVILLIMLFVRISSNATNNN